MGINRRTTRVIVLGSTGSIGVNTLQVIEALSPRFEVVGLSAGRRWDLLKEQMERFQPLAVALADGPSTPEPGGRVPGCRLYTGAEGICRLLEEVDADVVVGAITGWAGFRPCLKAIELGRRLALANKETLVVGGAMVREAAERSGAVLLPIDSEESAIFQAMQAGRASEIRRVYLTASGGPFYGWPAQRLATATPQQALCHPNWSMGRRISIDSATLMNKALEIVETRWLFDLAPDRIKVLLHPQSIVHSMVEFEDRSILAQLGAPDMKVPIQYAMTYPDRVQGPGERLGFETMQRLELHEASADEYPALRLGYHVAETGGTSGAAMNAANEVAVDAFLAGRIAFTDIVRVVERVLEAHTPGAGRDFDELQQADRHAREEAIQCITT